MKNTKIIKIRFIRLRMIWNIIRRRTVLYNVGIKDGIVNILTDGAVIKDCIFDNIKSNLICYPTKRIKR